MKRLAALIIFSIVMGICINHIARGNLPVARLSDSRYFYDARTENGESSARIARLAGMTPVHGQGIRLIVDDATRDGSNSNVPVERLIVHERDLMLIRNELFAAGATAMSINGERMVATTEIRCVGPAIRINTRNTAPPYYVDAVGDPKVLKKAVLVMGGLFDILTMERISVKIEEKDNLVIPSLISSVTVRPEAQQ